MNADYVENIIRNIDKQSYKCILVDGAWGIGKSYVGFVIWNGGCSADIS